MAGGEEPNGDQGDRNELEDPGMDEVLQLPKWVWSSKVRLSWGVWGVWGVKVVCASVCGRRRKRRKSTLLPYAKQVPNRTMKCRQE